MSDEVVRCVPPPPPPPPFFFVHAFDSNTNDDDGGLLFILSDVLEPFSFLSIRHKKLRTSTNTSILRIFFFFPSVLHLLGHGCFCAMLAVVLCTTCISYMVTRLFTARSVLLSFVASIFLLRARGGKPLTLSTFCGLYLRRRADTFVFISYD